MAGSARVIFPPPSTPQRRAASPPKRPRLDEDDVFAGADATPRSPLAMPPPPSPALRGRSSPSKQSSRSSTTKTESSQPSKASSPAKNVAALAIRSDPIELQSFVNPAEGVVMPLELADMLKDIRNNAYGRGVVSDAMKVGLSCL
jgi:hypothetical protein